MCNKLFNVPVSHLSLLFEKHDSINISSLLRLNYTKMLIKTKQHFPCLYRSKVVYEFIKVSFCCFIPFYSHHSYITQPSSWLIVDRWGPELWKEQFQFTERSFAAWSKYCITLIVSIICKAIRRMSGGLQNAIILSYTTWNQHFAI